VTYSFGQLVVPVICRSAAASSDSRCAHAVLFAKKKLLSLAYTFTCNYQLRFVRKLRIQTSTLMAAWCVFDRATRDDPGISVNGKRTTTLIHAMPDDYLN